jgi:prevent-host-death family protein
MRQIGSYEAKTHLPRLLDEVEAGETITITKHGRPVAVLAPPPGVDRTVVPDAVSGLRAFRATHRLEDVAIRDLIDEGRR